MTATMTLSQAVAAANLSDRLGVIEVSDQVAILHLKQMPEFAYLMRNTPDLDNREWCAMSFARDGKIDRDDAGTPFYGVGSALVDENIEQLCVEHRIRVLFVQRPDTAKRFPNRILIKEAMKASQAMADLYPMHMVSDVRDVLHRNSRNV